MTHTIALALKAANFPQPIPREGQYWYTKDGTCFNLSSATVMGNAKISDLKETLEDAGMVYCPAAEDIFEALPSSCSVSKGLSGFVVKHGYHKEEFGIYTGPTLVEALGNAYLAIYPQP